MTIFPIGLCAAGSLFSTLPHPTNNLLYLSGNDAHVRTYQGTFRPR
jgi:hypothetical protein